MHEKVFCGIEKHLNVSAETLNSHLFTDTQGFSAIGLEPIGACHVATQRLQASGTTL